MTTDKEILVRAGTATDLPRLEHAWLDLYRVQHRRGMRIDLPPNAFALWKQSMEVSFGRFSTLFLAERGDTILGFLACRIRSLPPYFGGTPVGLVSDIYVAEASRGHGLGKRLLEQGTRWFQTQGIRRLELQVFAGNEEARAFYRGQGWHDELLQMVREL